MSIKELRQKRYLSQERLAELCGLSLRTIQRVEAGHRIGYASLVALATELAVNVEALEQELNTAEAASNEFKDLPLWLRLYVGWGWLGASRKEFQKIEIFFLCVGILFLSLIPVVYFFKHSPMAACVMTFGAFCGLLGAYNVSVTIRVGDRFDIWSRLESTLPQGIFDKSKVE
ncbi:MAG TPA: helix-turn-helix transcriptional regulator [Cellvibrio sp.]|nr:helix-turn-helix transcriptional regulator [Cellvibrio sp.]